MATEFGKRLRQAREHALLTQLQLARQVGISQSTLAAAEATGHGSRVTAQLAKALNVNPHWLATGDGPQTAPLKATEEDSVGYRPDPIQLIDNPDFPAVRRVHLRLSAGASGYAVDFADDDDAPIVFRREWFRSRGLDPTKLIAVRVINGSMEPGLWHGDTVIINTADTLPRDGEVFAINFEGEMVIKRLVRDAGQWWLSSDNPDKARYPNKRCTDSVTLIGRIVHKQSEKI